MQVKQSSVKVCEVDLVDENEFISYFDKNYALFKNHLISINGNISQKIEEYLNAKELKYLVNTQLPKSKNQNIVKKDITPIKVEDSKHLRELEKELLELKNKAQRNFTVLDTLIRSGRELNIEGDLLLLNRVNSGATITIDGNLIITQIVDGSIRCNGNFMMLKASQKANIVFHDVEVDNSFLKERLNRVELKNDEIIVTPVLKETSWV